MRLILSTKPELMLAKKISLDRLREWSTRDWEAHFIEPKIDGDRFCREKGKWLSRGGKEYFNVDEIKKAINRIKGVNDLLIDGELVGDDWEHTQSVVRRFRSKPKGEVRYIVFDAVPNDQPQLQLRHRADIVNKIVRDAKHRLVTAITRHEVTGFDAFMDVYNHCLASGCDGVMIKQKSGPYECKRSKYWLKLKPHNEMDCKIVAVKEGKGKYRGMVGSIGVVIPLPGNKWSERVTYVSGLDDHQREKLWAKKKELIGSLAEVRYREITKVNRLKEPRLSRLRTDK